MRARDHDLAELVKTAGKKNLTEKKKLSKRRLDEKDIFSARVIMITSHFGLKRDRLEALIGEFIVMSLFTFLLISIRSNP